MKYLWGTYLIVCALAVTLVSCSPVANQQSTVDLSTGNSVLTIYLNNKGERDTGLKIEDIELKSDDIWLAIDPYASASSTSEQQLIALTSLPAARYENIRFTMNVFNNQNSLLRSEQVELAIQDHLVLKESGSQCLFIQSSITPRTLNRPLATLLSAEHQQAPLSDNLLYILCSDIETLYIARTDNFNIMAAYPLQGEVSDMVIDNHRRLVYLLDKKSQLIKRWDGISQQMTDRIPLPMTQSPEGLEISETGAELFVTDTANRQLLKLDANNGTVLNQVNIGYEPSRPYWFEHDNQRRLALISRGDQQLHILRADNLAAIATISAGQHPYEVIYANNWLYVSDSFDHQLLQINPDNGLLQARIPTGIAPKALAIDTINRNVLITQQAENSLALLPFGQQLIAREVMAGDSPCDVTISDNRRLLYISNKQSNSVTVLDLPSEKIINSIRVGSTPNVIAIQEQ